ncbi:MAG: sugar porter family MFS transporter [Pseudomonadota bacterium]
MSPETRFTARVAAIVALGGFLMGFDASVISGVVGFIETEFSLSKVELGWSVASLTLTATLAMMVAGPLSDRLGRRPVLFIAAALFLGSAIASALATSFLALVIARMIGGLGVGAALIIAPMYIAEISPAAIRGRMVSFNQLNIVIGISAAFFTNYLILTLSQSDSSWVQSLGLEQWSWRWMLGLEALPAILYLVCLPLVPESPRWLMMKGREDEALAVLSRAGGAARAKAVLDELSDSLTESEAETKARLADLFRPAMRTVMAIGITVAVLQQITGINSVFFYAPMIFEQSGIGTNAAFMQAVAVGLTNLIFTVAAMFLIDQLGRRKLLAVGVSGIAICMFVLASSFSAATYQLTDDAMASLPLEVDQQALTNAVGVTYDSDLDFKAAMTDALGPQVFQEHESALVAAAIDMNATVVLLAILGFVASFAISLGPVMWVLFSELFPNTIRGLAISFVGLINSAVSFGVQLVFPWELATLGNAATFMIYGSLALVGLVVVLRLLPETKGQTLEQIEQMLVTPRVSHS